MDQSFIAGQHPDQATVTCQAMAAWGMLQIRSCMQLVQRLADPAVQRAATRQMAEVAAAGSPAQLQEQPLQQGIEPSSSSGLTPPLTVQQLQLVCCCRLMKIAAAIISAGADCLPEDRQVELLAAMQGSARMVMQLKPDSPRSCILAGDTIYRCNVLTGEGSMEATGTDELELRLCQGGLELAQAQAQACLRAATIGVLWRPPTWRSSAPHFPSGVQCLRRLWQLSSKRSWRCSAAAAFCSPHGARSFSIIFRGRSSSCRAPRPSCVAWMPAAAPTEYQRQHFEPRLPRPHFSKSCWPRHLHTLPTSSRPVMTAGACTACRKVAAGLRQCSACKQGDWYCS